MKSVKKPTNSDGNKEAHNKAHGHSHNPHYQNIKIKELPESEVEITGEITAQAFASLVCMFLDERLNASAGPAFRTKRIHL